MGRGKPPAPGKAPGVCSANPTLTIGPAQPRVGVGVQGGSPPQTAKASLCLQSSHTSGPGETGPHAEAVCPRLRGPSKK